jgi:hypothetical protein
MAQYTNQQNPDANKQTVMRFPKGVDQVSPETSLLPGTARSLVNYDVHQGAVGQDGPVGGRVSARSQVQKVISGTNVHSLWSGDHNTCYVSNGSLYRLGEDMAPVLVRAAVGDAEMYYTEIAGVVFYSNGSLTGTVVNGNDAPWGLPLPVGPIATPVAFGGLVAGNYMVAYTYMDASGRESGATQTALVTVATGGGITLAAPTTGTGSGQGGNGHGYGHTHQYGSGSDGSAAAGTGYITRVYVSPPNGDNLYWAMDIPAGASVAYVGVHTPGKLLTTQHMMAPEPCTQLENYNGRIYSAVGNTLLATQALNYDLTRPSTDFVVFPDPITMIKSVVDGVYVGTRHGVAYLDGNDLPLFRTRPADMLPPIEGSALAVDGGLFGESGKGIVWLTRRGWIFGTAGGKVKRLTEAQMALPEYDRAASLYREHDGMRQVLSFVKGGGEAAGASDSYDVEIVRNGRIV